MSYSWLLYSGVPLLVALIEGLSIAALYSRKLGERIGFDSMILIFVACGLVPIVATAGYVAAAGWFIVPAHGGGILHLILVTSVAWPIIIHYLALELA